MKEYFAGVILLLGLMWFSAPDVAWYWRIVCAVAVLAGLDLLYAKRFAKWRGE